MAQFKFLSDNQNNVDWIDMMIDARNGHQSQMAFRINGGIPRWVMGNGEVICVSDMTVPHIRNVINCLNGLGNVTIPEVWGNRTKNFWLNVMNEELSRRNNITQ